MNPDEFKFWILFWSGFLSELEVTKRTMKERLNLRIVGNVQDALLAFEGRIPAYHEEDVTWCGMCLDHGWQYQIVAYHMCLSNF